MTQSALTNLPRLKEYRAYVAGYLESAASLICVVQEDMGRDNTRAQWADVCADLEQATTLLDRAARRISPLRQGADDRTELYDDEAATFRSASWGVN